jgi:hypothetical protein
MSPKFNIKRASLHAGLSVSLVIVSTAPGLSVLASPTTAQAESEPLAEAAPSSVQTPTRPVAPSEPAPGPELVGQASSSSISTPPIVSGLSEQPRLINACRFSPEQSLVIYEDAARTRILRTLTAPTEGVFLTGIVGTGLAQIRQPVLGWIGTGTIEPCTTPIPTPGPTPAPTPTPTPSTQACYEVRAAQLTVRTSTSTTATALGVYGSGSKIYATANPPREVTGSDGRIWTEIKAPNGNGWVARTGPNGVGENAVRLADSECRT